MTTLAELQTEAKSLGIVVHQRHSALTLQKKIKAHGLGIEHASPKDFTPSPITQIKNVDGLYELPQSLPVGDILDVRYDGRGKWTKGWFKEAYGQYQESTRNATSSGHRVQFMSSADGIRAHITNYGWRKLVTIVNDSNKPAPVRLNSMLLTQMSGDDERQYEGYRLPEPFQSLANAAVAVEDWIEGQEAATRAGIIQTATQVL
jgi:hypothetical protein